MNEKCPHGYPHPVTAGSRACSGPVENTSRVCVIHDSRDCPECLKLQIAKANEILKQAFDSRGVSTAETYILWMKYAQRYNP